MTNPFYSHLDDHGRVRMVDVGDKPLTRRTAKAEARVRLNPQVAAQVANTGAIAKGNVLETARIAGIMAAKRTAEIIPMCHSLMLDTVNIDICFEQQELVIVAEARCTGPTGVEMEAMTAVTVAALTVYDMCKSADKNIVITCVRLLAKSGGKSGDWTAPHLTVRED
ncbi:MAG: cyclic pyranopterin monophosphate synthase MoaC [Candidatus Hydrogenedentes bacterium]|nr:cyclic pyranopterin monophosphate synthase MoaC [Candidatus Hydrogenedentota bacterium]